MSICPDSDLYSAYIDGEVPSPWKEKLESHIDSCPRCKKQIERYRALRSLIAAGLPQEALNLEASFERLSARRAEVYAAIAAKEPLTLPAWVRQSVKIPITALAAMFLAAVFLPAIIVLRTTSGTRSQAAPLALAETDAKINQTASYRQGQILSRTSQVYSTDLSSNVLQTKSYIVTGRNAFSMVNYARQFAANQELFSNADIIIIKLPKLANFDTADLFLSDEEALPRAAGFN